MTTKKNHSVNFRKAGILPKVKLFNKNTTLKEILDRPGAEEILIRRNLPCLSCPMAAIEISELKLGEICEAYGLDLEKILKDLNR